MSAPSLWTAGWREAVWSRLGEPWDLVVIGGGITGAGILAEATRLGLKALLVEQRDFAWGTSSRSSKLVHGGLRYLKQGELGLVRDAVRERQRLLVEGRGLVEPLGFLVPTRTDDRSDRWLLGLGLSIYDVFAGRFSHRRYGPVEFRMLAPHLTEDRLDGGFQYLDAKTDDARLTLRVLREAVARGGAAINYAVAEALCLEGGRAAGLRLRDAASGRVAEARARVVINATGAWADRMRGEVGAPGRIRPLRGSHLVFPAWRLPVAQAIMFLHASDRRPIFVIPWEGATLVGTTDLDHDRPLDDEPGISSREVAYLMDGLRAQFPSLGLIPGDAVASFAGVRPVIGSGKADPSKEARDHVVWEEKGLLTVTGGKLTTFRLIARDALRAVRHRLPGVPELGRDTPVLTPAPDELAAASLDPEARLRLLGRYGAEAAALVSAARPDELTPIPGTRTLWAELRWAARAEGVVHLDDLLLRRVRVGLLLPAGGLTLAARIRAVCQTELGWDDARWEREEEAYRSLWTACYGLPA